MNAMASDIQNTKSFFGELVNKMKHSHAFLSIVLVATAALACIITTASQAVAQVDDFVVDGIHVLLEPTKANQIVAVVVGIEGGFGRMETDNPALPAMMAAVTTSSGSDFMSKSQYREALSRLVTTIDARTGRFDTKYLLSCVKPKLAESWKIFASVLQHPLYDQEEFARLREQAVSDIAGRHADPEGSTRFVIDSIWTQSLAIWRPAQIKDVNSVTIDQLKAYHDKELERSRMTVVVVGDVSRDEITRMIHSSFASIPKGNYVREPYATVAGLATTDLVVDNRVVPTAYIYGRFLAPPRRDPIFWPLVMGGFVLDDRLYEEVRTKRNLSYSPHSYVTGNNGKYFGQLSVSTTMPDSTMHVMNREFAKIREDGITSKELKDRRAEFITEYYMSQQSNIAVAVQLYTTLLETGDWHRALTVIKDVNAVSLGDVKTAMRKYLHDIYWVAVGDRSKMTRTDFLFH